MCGFCGYIDLELNITNDKIIQNMTNTLTKRGPNFQDIYIDKNIALGHTRLSIIDVISGNQPMQKTHLGNKYIIVYNGELYNTESIRNDLIQKGYDFTTKCDTEVVLCAYIEYKEECVKKFNGIFAFAIQDEIQNCLFLARDRLGIKPLFYTQATIPSQKFIFASEIKALLAHPDIHAIINKESIKEIFGLGPAHTPGKSFLKNIVELEAGHIAYLKDNVFTTHKYWDLETKECFDSQSQSIEKIHDLVVNSTKKQLVSDVGICSMLSGGLDSSILTKIAKDNISDLATFSIDYIENEKNFVSNDYQMTKDSDYVKIMKDFLKTTHKTIKIKDTALFDFLENSMIARDMPGMADIDSSMYIFCKKITENGFKVCLSGECSDEIFGGYPWFYKENLIAHKGFPWALSENLRENIVKKGILKPGELTEYIATAKKTTLKNVVHLNESDEFENRFRDINYLTIKWFMNTLIERTDRMSMANALEVRVPFADHKIFEYVYNLPAKTKLGLNNSKEPIEKFLLRKAFENELPKDIVYRKKSPFPKTYDPAYLLLVENKMKSILENKNSKILNLIDSNFVSNMLTTHGNSLTQNWFGQLMTYPQTLAYLIQIEMWLDNYNIEIEL
ncbi:MAG: asparagine synthase (glutamine-hydrolyzing) [Clostridia bacterium]